MDRIDYRSFESMQTLIKFITGFQLVHFDSEHVSTAIARFKAVVRLLPTAAIPPNILVYFLNVMSSCSYEEF
jgi:hypothetical protein